MEDLLELRHIKSGIAGWRPILIQMFSSAIAFTTPCRRTRKRRERTGYPGHLIAGRCDDQGASIRPSSRSTRVWMRANACAATTTTPLFVTVFTDRLPTNGREPWLLCERPRG